MLRIAIAVTIAALAVFVIPAEGAEQAPESQFVLLEPQSASRALDAVPAVFAIAQNLEGVDINVGIEGMANGFSDLTDQVAVQDQLIAALGSYGFEGYEDWAATIQTVFSIYAFIRSEGAKAAAIDQAMQQVLDDPGVPQAQKDSVVGRMDEPLVDLPGTAGIGPTHENLVVVLQLLPNIVSTIQMMQAMQ